MCNGWVLHISHSILAGCMCIALVLGTCIQEQRLLASGQCTSVSQLCFAPCLLDVSAVLQLLGLAAGVHV